MNDDFSRGMRPSESFPFQAQSAAEQMIQHRGQGVIEMAQEVAALLDYTDVGEPVEAFIFMRSNKEVVYCRSDQDMSLAFDSGETIQVITIGELFDDDFEDDGRTTLTYAHMTRPFQLSGDDLKSGEALINRINRTDCLMIAETGYSKEPVEVTYCFDGVQGIAGSKYTTQALKECNFDVFKDALVKTAAQLLSSPAEIERWRWIEPQQETASTITYDPIMHGPNRVAAIPFLRQQIGVSDVSE
jgi:hypothetical protein